MFTLRCLTRLSIPRTKRQCINLVKSFHDEFSTESPKRKTTTDETFKTSPAVASKFSVFSDDNATVILDIDEERQRISKDIHETEDLLADTYSGLNLESKVL